MNPDWGIPSSGAHSQTTSSDSSTVKTVSLAKGTKAIYVAATSNKVYMTFDGSTPSSTNGLPIIAGALPMYVSVGGPTVSWVGSSTSHTVDVLCLV